LTWLQPLRRRSASAYRAGRELDEAIAACRRLAGYGLASTIGYTPAPDERPRAVADAQLVTLERLAAEKLDSHVSVKLSGLRFDERLFGELVAAAAQAGRSLHVDALGPETVDATWRLLENAPRDARVGTTLPGRWHRSVEDVALAASLGLRVRVVKGQWPDLPTNGVDPRRGFLNVVERLRGHPLDVGVATHDVEVLAESVRRLHAAGTPCTAELYFGLPFRAPALLARQLGVPVRVYVAYGHAGAPYAAADIRRNPAAAWWLVQDLLLGKDKTWLSIRRSSGRR
jgi:proline dehydrogenase